MFDFEYHLKNLPSKPGVYLMKNSLGEVIYVGKAKILKNRVVIFKTLRIIVKKLG